MDRPVQFYFRGEIRRLSAPPPTRTVLQWLREDLRQTGTKEGCAEGDCGACMVVLGDLQDGRLRLRAINACIRLLPTLDRMALFTVEDLADFAGGALHPVQAALVDCHGSQCGFCTPGFVMSLWVLYETQPQCPTRAQVTDTLSGNLCRCTGYRPIIEAARRAYESPRQPWASAAVVDALRELQRLPALSYASPAGRYTAPRSLEALDAACREEPQARLLSGSTDIGLWITKHLRTFEAIIHVGAVEALREIRSDAAGLVIGAGASLAESFAALCAQEPGWEELARRFASVPIRNAGTLGGNVANGSPIGDGLPGLIALGATVVLRRAGQERELPMEDFYLGYQRNALTPGEYLRCVRVPAPPHGLRQVFATYKVSRRQDQDIAAVCAAFCLRLEADGRIAHARMAFGGMDATARRAAATEAALLGELWCEATLARAQAALAADYRPLTDLRASSAYRQAVAVNLLRRFWLQQDPAAALRLSDLRPVEA